MVDIDEIDDEGIPLRYPESAYHRPPPSLLSRCLRPFKHCCRGYVLTRAQWFLIVTYAVLVGLGYAVVRGSADAGTPQYQSCNRLYSWVVIWVLGHSFHLIWWTAEAGFYVSSPVVVDPSVPGGLRELAPDEKNSSCFLALRTLRSVICFMGNLAFLIVGIELIRNAACTGFADLWLYFKGMFWLLVTLFSISGLILLCGACVACLAILQAVNERRARY